MKILDLTFKRKVNCSANVCLWNHWDQDHINYVHSGFYNETEIFYEDDIPVYFGTFFPSRRIVGKKENRSFFKKQHICRGSDSCP